MCGSVASAITDIRAGLLSAKVHDIPRLYCIAFTFMDGLLRSVSTAMIALDHVIKKGEKGINLLLRLLQLTGSKTCEEQDQGDLGHGPQMKSSLLLFFFFLMDRSFTHIWLKIMMPEGKKENNAITGHAQGVPFWTSTLVHTRYRGEIAGSNQIRPLYAEDSSHAVQGKALGGLGQRIRCPVKEKKYKYECRE